MAIGDAMVLARLTDRMVTGVEEAVRGVSDYLMNPVIRLGVTGLSQSGKTVFVTALVANLLERGRMGGLRAEAEGRILAAYLEPQPDHGLPRFAWEDHRAALAPPDPVWPDSTRALSTLRLTLRVRPAGFLAQMTGDRVVHLDILDYPGEWLMDLGLMEADFAAWSKAEIARARSPHRADLAAAWLSLLSETDPAARLSEDHARRLAAAYTAYLASARAAGLALQGPGRFLLPGDLEGAPLLTFCPLPAPAARLGSASLGRAFARRYDAYRDGVVAPFFRRHFARIDRQIVLIDALGAVEGGPIRLAEMQEALAGILRAFRPGRNSWLSAILGRRVERLMVAATKADHLHSGQHPRLAALAAALVADAAARANLAGAATRSLALASLRATIEETLPHGGERVDLVRGRLAATGRMAAIHPGDLPRDPQILLAAARRGEADWPEGAFAVPRFAPPLLELEPGQGMPHIRLDQAVEFLIGDRLT